MHRTHGGDLDRNACFAGLDDLDRSLEVLARQLQWQQLRILASKDEAATLQEGVCWFPLVHD